MVIISGPAEEYKMEIINDNEGQDDARNSVEGDNEVSCSTDNNNRTKNNDKIIEDHGANKSGEVYSSNKFDNHNRDNDRMNYSIMKTVISISAKTITNASIKFRMAIRKLADLKPSMIIIIIDIPIKYMEWEIPGNTTTTTVNSAIQINFVMTILTKNIIMVRTSHDPNNDDGNELGKLQWKYNNRSDESNDEYVDTNGDDNCNDDKIRKRICYSKFKPEGIDRYNNNGDTSFEIGNFDDEDISIINSCIETINIDGDEIVNARWNNRIPHFRRRIYL